MERGDRKLYKKGLSTVVTTLIIILLVIIALGIVWTIVKNLLDKEKGGIENQNLLLDLKVISSVKEADKITVKVSRSAGEGEFDKIKFVFEDANKNSAVIEKPASIAELGSEDFVFLRTEFTGIDFDKITKVSIYPVYSSGGIGSLEDTKIISKNLETLPDGSGQGELLYEGGIYRWEKGTNTIITANDLGDSGTIQFDYRYYKLYIIGGNNNAVRLGVSNLQVTLVRDFFSVTGTCNSPTFNIPPSGNVCEDSSSGATYKVYKIN